jgi:hypothetical protein
MSGKADTSDDAILSAYLDDELSGDEAGRLHDRLVGDPALARRLEEMRAANLAARSFFRAADGEPLPQGVLDLLNDEADSSTQERSEANVVRFPARGLWRYFQPPVAIAASVALAVGFLAGDMAHRTQDADVPGLWLYAGTIPEASELYDFLESGISGVPQTLPSGIHGRLILTFENKDSDWCRQLQLAAETGSAQALACRRQGAWQMEAVAYDVEASPEGSYLAASSSTLPALDAAIDEQIGGGEPLDVEAEKLLISNSWRKPEE